MYPTHEPRARARLDPQNNSLLFDERKLAFQKDAAKSDPLCFKRASLSSFSGSEGGGIVHACHHALRVLKHILSAYATFFTDSLEIFGASSQTVI